jgi:hypothetical protein
MEHESAEVETPSLSLHSGRMSEGGIGRVTEAGRSTDPLFTLG